MFYIKKAYFNDILVGAMTCREEVKDGEKCVYILTIGVLTNYRRYKIGKFYNPKKNASIY